MWEEAHHFVPANATSRAGDRCSGNLRRVRRIGVLASGSGTILESLIDAELPIALVVVDRPCRAIEVGEAAGIPVELIERESFGPDFDRLAYTELVVDALKRHEIDLAAMAGFMTILEHPIHDAYDGRITNTHPSLLPAFRGAHAVEDALAAGVKVTGCTVHIATLELDNGPILAQEVVPVLPDDTPETLHERVKEVERRLYPQVLRELLEDAS
jgi:phosphoribosylglycinamide formyltransferase 1